jgi:hypothetical protein
MAQSAVLDISLQQQRMQYVLPKKGGLPAAAAAPHAGTAPPCKVLCNAFNS